MFDISICSCSSCWLKLLLALSGKKFLSIKVARGARTNNYMVDNLSWSLQTATMSACKGQQVVKTTLATYATIWTDQCFNILWDYLESRRSSVDVSPLLYFLGRERFLGNSKLERCFWGSWYTQISLQEDLYLKSLILWWLPKDMQVWAERVSYVTKLERVVTTKNLHRQT